MSEAWKGGLKIMSAVVCLLREGGVWYVGLLAVAVLSEYFS